MLLILYVSPSVIPRYAITTQSQYYQDQCVIRVSNRLGIPAGTGQYNSSLPDAQWYCNVSRSCRIDGGAHQTLLFLVQAMMFCGLHELTLHPLMSRVQVMMFCGFPLERQLAQTAACPLYPLWQPAQVPGDEQQAICLNTTTTGCDLYSKFVGCQCVGWDSVSTWVGSMAAAIHRFSLLCRCLDEWFSLLGVPCAGGRQALASTAIPTPCDMLREARDPLHR